ncbi:S8 family peptidase [Kribbella monticola]|uniref:S8 family peptidase n=1 Tax=Kribbella monticola TaxID=2185285 RepID=UPI001E603EA9|nr:S8 family serine peptidase [Kribbella monticola]
MIGPTQKVTLITGDRVTLQGGENGRVAVEPGPGRRGLMFSTHRTQSHLYIIPSDVRSAVNDGRLDRQLFDVAGLARDGLDDRSSSSIPLLVTYSGRARQRAAMPGATVTRELPSVNGAAIRVAKATAAGFLAGVQPARSSLGAAKIWLDGKRRVTLDQSVPQIGAPAAWQAGFTGTGVSVAVLDTGIDASHPDLATQVVGAKNFTDDPAGDHYGHGTHVASTIAGTGAASNGRYKGVAPGAKLYDGKVCDDTGDCQDSAILAGMEWAATEVKAKVVNLSLGREDTAAIDPLEEAVERLTSQTGTLFVVAAGNNGPGEGTIDSPGSADAALTVGAVDKDNRLADFSSRGPRVGDGAVKPDISAPGVSIVAAKAKDSVIGEPVGDDYLRLGGTSMATPHVAGSAAILAQEHPDWKAAELKGVLMGSARPAAGQTAFEQGAGRVDVAKGITQTVVAEPGNLSFGTARWPHDDDTPVTRTLTYRNLGDRPVTLDLAASLSGPDGGPAPTDALVLSTSTVTVPAGSTAAVQVTSNTKHSGSDGTYSGRVTATGPAGSVTSAVGVDKEPERYDLTITHLGPDGAPSSDDTTSTEVWGLDQAVDLVVSGASAKVRLPKGEYLIDAQQQVGEDFYLMVQPSLQLTKDSTVVLDARRTAGVKVALPRPDAGLIIGDVGYRRTTADPARETAVNGLTFDLSRIHMAQVGADVPAALMTGHIASQWGKPGIDGDFRNSPYLYGLVSTTSGGYPNGLDRTVHDKDLATVCQTVNATTDRVVERTLSAGTPDGAGFLTPGVRFDSPITTTAFLEPGISWATGVQDPAAFPEFSGVGSEAKVYRTALSYRERFNAAPFVPSPQFAQRAQDRLRVQVAPVGDADGNRGRSQTDSAGTVLFRNGVKIAETPIFGYVEATGLPAGKASYRLETSQTRQTYATLSTRTDLVWTFSSAEVPEPATLPLLSVRYRPKVDSHNVVERTSVSVLPLVVDAQPGATLPRIRTLQLQVSGDEGKTWRSAEVKAVGQGRYTAVFATPGATKISLRSHLVDADGNITDQTVLNAYPLA